MLCTGEIIIPGRQTTSLELIDDHDSFKVTEADKVRMSASVLLNQPIETEGEIGRRSVEAGKFIVGSFEVELRKFEKSWTGLFLWMNENG